jgi:uncharacterized protein YodC (DUF2158 family)
VSKEDFKTGTIVRLKSGGPTMTVKVWSTSQDQYVCQWFAGKKLEQGFFHPDSLIVVDDAAGAA